MDLIIEILDDLLDMKFNLIQSEFDPEMAPLLKREIKKHKVLISRLSQKNLKEIAALSQILKEKELPDYFLRKKLNAKLGYGIFLHPYASPLVKGQVVGLYSGEISLIPQNAPDSSGFAFNLISNMHLEKEVQTKWDRENRYHPRRLYTFKLDALKKGNFTRYINHSEKPNLIAYMVSIPENSFGINPSPIEIVYFVKRKINPGEQLLISYEAGEKSYWEANEESAYPMDPKTFKLKKPSPYLFQSY